MGLQAKTSHQPSSWLRSDPGDAGGYWGGGLEGLATSARKVLH